MIAEGTRPEQIHERFPSPPLLNLPAYASETASFRTLVVTEQDVRKPENLDDFSKLTSSLSLSSYIVDHTIPWGRREPSVLADLNRLLPPVQRGTDHLDLISGILALVTANDQVSRLTAIAPRFLMENPAHTSLRNYLIARLELLGIVELPAAIFSPAAIIPTSLLSLASAPDKDDHLVAFTALSSRGNVVEPKQQQWFRDFLAGLKGRPMTLGFRARLAQERPWTMAAQHPESRQIEERLQNSVGTAPLGELCEVIPGVRHSREENTRVGVPVLRGRDLASENLSKESLSKFEVEAPDPDRAKIKAGDILLQRIGARPHVAIATSALDGVVAGDTVFIVRPHDARVGSVVISEYLRSSIGQQVLLSRAQKTTAPTLSAAGLRSVPIPTPKEDLTVDLMSVRQIEEDLRTRADALAALRLGLFAAEHGAEFRTRVADLRRSARSIAVGLEQFESLSYRVRTLYPYPISYPYRALASITAPVEQYTEQLRVVEVILAFLASISLALLEPSDRETVRPLLRNSLRGGISTGSWRDLARTTSGALSGYDDSGFARSITALWAARHASFPAIVEPLIVARNDHHHGRGPRLEEEVRQANSAMDESLQELMSSLEFLIDYPIRQVREMDAIRRSRRVVLEARFASVETIPACHRNNLSTMNP